MILWVGVGVGVALLSLLVGLGVGAVLGHLGRQVSEVLEHEWWSTAPPTVRTR